MQANLWERVVTVASVHILIVMNPRVERQNQLSLEQQKRLYEAEKCLWDHGRSFSSVREVGDYLTDIMRTDWFVESYGWVPPIQIHNWSSSKWAGCASKSDWTIYLKRFNENVVLHELSHLLSPTDEHSKEFVDNFLFLIRNAMGFHAWAEFTSELVKVDYFGT